MRFAAGAAMQRLKIAAELMRFGAGTAAAGRAEASGKADPPGMTDGTLKRSRAASAIVSFLCLYHGYYRLHMAREDRKYVIYRTVSIPGGFTPLFRRLETIVPI